MPPLIRRRTLLAATLAPWPAARAQEIEPLQAAGCTFELQFDDGFPPALRQAVRGWVERSALAVKGWLGRFPLPAVELVLQGQAGAGVGSGVTFGEPEPYIRVRLGQETPVSALRDDWVLVHEMIHLALPRLERRHGWLHEGVATYGEGLARCHAGLTDAGFFWSGLVRGLPQGLPAEGDRGLDFTPTWGRRYWGGALFCLLADVQMRRRGGPGLREALQRVGAAGGSYAVQWPVERVLEAADAGTGQRVLALQYDAWKDRPVAVDLPALWAELGVAAAGGGPPRLDGAAPLAAVRRAIAS